MNKLFEALFPEGKRKLMITILALAIGAGFEKFGGGLSDEMVTAILGLVGIFTGGNMVEHIMSVIKGKKQAKPIEQDMSSDIRNHNQQPMSLEQLFSKVYVELDNIRNNAANVNEQLKIQASNTAAIVNVINTMRGAVGPNGGQANVPRTPPTPNASREL